MPVEITLSLSPKQSSDSKVYIPIAARKLGIREDQIAHARIIRRSIDARSKSIKVNIGLEIFVDNEPRAAEVRFDYPDVSKREPIVIIGAGPAGLFAALRLIESGLKPIIIERGKDVSERKKDVAQINRNGDLNPDSNYAFGEGGAGAYSDGKLFTRSKKRGDFRHVLEVLRFHGADESILFDAHPHIGTECLPRIIAAIRKTILASGGEILYNSRLENIFIKGGIVTGISYGDGNKIDTNTVILATGHSARDIYDLLHNKNILLVEKPFAMGVRIEHPQALIDSIQYHVPQRGEYLPAASYSLVAQIANRGVYSFCMCPGGFIVPAMTADKECVVNGMSPSGRHHKFANSGIVTEVRAEDYAHLVPRYGVLAGLQFQREFEAAAFKNGGGKQIVPGQRVADFVGKKTSANLPDTSYNSGAVSSEMHRWMPKFISSSLRYGLDTFGKRMRGFVTNEAMILGVESRTSSPIRIPRDDQTLMHPEVTGLYPCGEGAGYAGGIVSAAMDGEKVAETIANNKK